jgi:hypothetical protein
MIKRTGSLADFGVFNANSAVWVADFVSAPPTGACL